LLPVSIIFSSLAPYAELRSVKLNEN
jgi:hypothetical protein